MNAKLLILVPPLFLLGACAHTSVAPAHAKVETPVASLPAKAAEPAAPASPAAVTQTAAAAPEKEAAPAESALTGQLLYQFLLGEIAGQRGDLKLSAEAYADLAHKTRDVRVVRRAAEIAIYAHDMAKAVDMAQLWVELEPKSAQARRLLASALVSSGHLDEAKPQLEALLKLEGQSVGEAFLQLHALLGRSQDKAAVLAMVKSLAAGYPKVPEAHLAVVQSAIEAGQRDLALSELDEVLRLTPGSETAALIKGQVLSSQDETAALAFWKAFLAEHQDADRVRLAYARELTKAGRFDEARSEFEILTKKVPESPELHLAIGLLSMQVQDLDTAEQSFSQALALGYPDDGLVKMYLGEVNEVRQRYEKALDWYRQVTTGGHVLQAQLKAAVVLGKMKRVDEALAVLDRMKVDDETGKVRIAQAGAQILREAGRYQDAIDRLTKALAAAPKAGDLLYDRAMLEEKVDRLPEMETDLRQLIKLQPDSAHAYNALGYTLVDRTNRIDEGLALLDKALKLSPDDPFILDSMGWGQYKAGHLAEAVEYLRRAYGGRADPEIAAHLGEVLWQQGKQDEAKRVWHEAAKAHPDNELLQKTLSRFGQ
jgi:tetratricopeptide (TPR) repeat protein